MAFGVSAQASGIGVADSLQPTDSSSIVEGSMLSRDGDAGLSYVNDRIYIFVDDSQEMEDGSFYSQAAWDAASMAGGEVIGKMPGLPEYQVRVPSGDYVDLDEVCSNMVSNVRGVTGAIVDVVLPIGVDAISPDWSGLSGGIDWRSIVNMPDVDAIMGNEVGAPIGVIDGYFYPDVSNVSVYISESDKAYCKNLVDMYSDNPDFDASSLGHGTEVASIAGAAHTFRFDGCAVDGTLVYGVPMRGQGLTGLTDQDLASNFFNAMATCLLDGCKVINCSVSLLSGNIPQTRLDTMRNYMAAYFCKIITEYNDDFLLVQAAGNDGKLSKSTTGLFSGMTFDNVEAGMDQYFHSQEYEDKKWLYGEAPTDYKLMYHDLRNRVIIVGESQHVDGLNKRYYATDFGMDVEIYAPAIDMPFIGEGGSLGIDEGTSYAAPIVLGVASMIWGLYPDFSPADVRDCIIGGSHTRLDDSDSVLPIPFYLMNCDFLLDVDGAFQYAAILAGELAYPDISDEYTSPCKYNGGSGTDLLRIGQSSMDPHLLDARFVDYAFCLERNGKYLNSSMDVYGSIYGTFYIPQHSSDGNIYLKVRRPIYTMDKSGPFGMYLCKDRHNYGSRTTPLGGKCVYRVPDGIEYIPLYVLYPVGSLVSDVPLSVRDKVSESEGVLVKSFLYGRGAGSIEYGISSKN